MRGGVGCYRLVEDGDSRYSNKRGKVRDAGMVLSKLGWDDI